MKNNNIINNNITNTRAISNYSNSILPIYKELYDLLGNSECRIIQNLNTIKELDSSDNIVIATARILEYNISSIIKCAKDKILTLNIEQLRVYFLEVSFDLESSYYEFKCYVRENSNNYIGQLDSIILSRFNGLRNKAFSILAKDFHA